MISTFTIALFWFYMFNLVQLLIDFLDSVSGFLYLVRILCCLNFNV